jgi:hypothetical protein
MNNEDKIIEVIRRFAEMIMQDVKDYNKVDKNYTSKTRLELAENLKKYGVQEDSNEVNNYVYLAYSQAKTTKDRKNVYYAFVNNEKTRFLVEEYAIKSSFENNDNKGALVSFKNNKEKGVNELDKVTEEISLLQNVLQKVVGNENFSIIGSGKVASIQNKITDLYEKYSTLIEQYNSSTNEIKSVIYDFTMVRSEILSIYRSLVSTLINCFGDSIKSVAPNVFNFDSIEWLDTASMMNETSLKYNSLSDSCANLMNVINENFSNSVRGSLDTIRFSGDKRLGLLLAGLNMVNHYIDSNMQSNMLNREFVSFQNSIKHDIATIKADTCRISTIYKLFNDLYIPQANIFFQHFDKVASKELDDLTNSMYTNKNIQKLRDEQISLINECQEIEECVIDLEKDISYYKKTIAQCKETIEISKDEYYSAQRTKPSKPFFLFNLLTLGYLGSQYNRAITEWVAVCKPVVESYEELVVEIEMDTAELERCENSYKEKMSRLNKSKIALKNVSNKIKEQISADNDVKVKLLPHLKDLILLLKVAKAIIESSLKDNLIKTAKIAKRDVIELDETEKTYIDKFVSRIGEELNVSIVKGDIVDPVSISYNQAINNLTTLVQSSIELQHLKNQQKINDKEYEKELLNYQEMYKKEMSAIDNKSEALNKVLAQINTADNIEDVKTGLIALVNSEGVQLTDEDIVEFLENKKTIII